MCFFMIKLVLNSGCHTRIGFTADNSTSVLDCIADINFRELCDTQSNLDVAQ